MAKSKEGMLQGLILENGSGSLLTCLSNKGYEGLDEEIRTLEHHGNLQ